jgi:hypothetical protein
VLVDDLRDEPVHIQLDDLRAGRCARRARSEDASDAAARSASGPRAGL